MASWKQGDGDKKGAKVDGKKKDGKKGKGKKGGSEGKVDLEFFSPSGIIWEKEIREEKENHNHTSSRARTLNCEIQKAV